MDKLILHMCSSCRNLYEWGEETTLFIYTKQPLVNHLVTTCSICQFSQTFWELSDDLFALLADDKTRPSDIVLKKSEFASARTWQKFCQATDRPYPSNFRLAYHRNQAIEREVADFRQLLDKGSLP